VHLLDRIPQLPSFTSLERATIIKQDHSLVILYVGKLLFDFSTFSPAIFQAWEPVGNFHAQHGVDWLFAEFIKAELHQMVFEARFTGPSRLSFIEFAFAIQDADCFIANGVPIKIGRSAQ
jgi:hypothetical protein